MADGNVYGNLINGEWVKGDKTFNDINPSDTNDVIGVYAQAGEAEVQAAIKAAREAFATWQFSTPQQRFDVLDNAGTEILARKEELGALLSREEGKTLPEGIGEVTRAGHIFKYFAGEALRAHGEVLDSVRPGVKVEITREPVGVIGLICPWNFPIAIPAWKMAPAIAFGNYGRCTRCDEVFESLFIPCFREGGFVQAGKVGKVAVAGGADIHLCAGSLASGGRR